MKLDTTVLLPVTAVVASVLLLLAGKKRVLEIIAVVASGAWLALQLQIFKWPLKGEYTSPGILLGGAMVVVGVLVYLKTDNKREVTCATALAILGGMLVVTALGRLG
jgi:hypothetical protein